MTEASIVEDLDNSISVNCGVSLWTMSNGLLYLEEDYRVAGEVWRVHKNDPDPYPSRPHAHLHQWEPSLYWLQAASRNAAIIHCRQPANRQVLEREPI